MEELEEQKQANLKSNRNILHYGCLIYLCYIDDKGQ